MKYDKTDAFAGGLFILFGLIFGVQALRLDMGTARDMGPGYFPVLLSAALVLFGAIVVYGAMKGPMQEIGLWALRGMAHILPAPLVFGLTVRGLGFVPAAFLTTLVAGRTTLDLSPARSLLLAVLVTAFSNPTVFLTRPISLTLLVLTLLVLIVVLSPQVRRKRDELFVESD